MPDALPLSEMKILVIDDEPANIALLRYILLAAGYKKLRTITDPRQTWEVCQEFQPDLILLDLMMPHLDGFGVMKLLDDKVEPEQRMPILVLTADVNVDTRHRALQVGASDFLTKPFDQIEVLLRIRHLLQIRSQHLQLTDRNEVLEDRVRERTAELSTTLHQLENTVHQLRTTQQQVIQHERLSALGSMAAGLAHDFNNALSLILGYSELLQGDLAEGPQRERTDDYLGIIMGAAQDAAKTFGRLRAFYRPVDVTQPRRPIDLNALVESAAAVTKPRWHAQALNRGVTVHLSQDLAPDLPPLLADASELREVLTNLIFNAVDAMPEGGTLTLRTRVESDAKSHDKDGALAAVAAGEGHTAHGGAIVLEVSDTGTGMSEETRRRCLEPFFTTKGHEGTGLGLAMVYGTVQRHGGTIDLRSALGQGTTFVLRLPLGLSEADDGTAESFEVGPVKPLRILAVDDQPAFLEVLQRYLGADHHTVETATDGDEALVRLQAGKFDLVITDKAMPGMSGEALAAMVKSQARETRVILLTGFGGLDHTADAPVPSVDMVLNKPVTNAALRAAVAKVVNTRPPETRRIRRPGTHAGAARGGAPARGKTPVAG